MHYAAFMNKTFQPIIKYAVEQFPNEACDCYDPIFTGIDWVSKRVIGIINFGKHFFKFYRKPIS